MSGKVENIQRQIKYYSSRLLDQETVTIDLRTQMIQQQNYA